MVFLGCMPDALVYDEVNTVTRDPAFPEEHCSCTNIWKPPTILKI